VSALDLDGDHLLPFTLPVADAGTANPSPKVTVLDADTGGMVSDGVVLRPPSTGDRSVRDVQNGIGYRQTDTNIGIVTFRSLVVPAGATLRIVGKRPVAVASAGTLVVTGLIDVRPWSRDGATLCGGTAPGGFAGGAAGSYGLVSHGGMAYAASPGSGPGAGPAGHGPAGGAGHAGVGGPGGCSASASNPCNAGGVAYDIASLGTDQFHGGSGGGGGEGASPQCTGGAGGNGGGAIRLVAASAIEIGGGATEGGVNASGCGGGKATNPTGSWCAGGGGGAGGAIVVESPRVQIDALGILNASGGGGGSDSRPGSTPEIASFASYGCFVPMFMAQTDRSGNGGAANQLAGNAGSGTTCSGGGGAGWIRINSGGAAPAINGGSFSPTSASGGFTIGATVAASP